MILRIRPSAPADAEALALLTGQLGYPIDAATMAGRLQDIAASGSGVVLVAEGADGNVAGYAHALVQRFTFADPFVELAALVVDESARSDGAGAALLQAVEDWTRGAGIATVYVRSAVSRERAHLFYLREGYHESLRQAVFVRHLG